ncbi:hypothetical protein YC2023_050833 [Brassica napus]
MGSQGSCFLLEPLLVWLLLSCCGFLGSCFDERFTRASHLSTQIYSRMWRSSVSIKMNKRGSQSRGLTYHLYLSASALPPPTVVVSFVHSARQTRSRIFSDREFSSSYVLTLCPSPHSNVTTLS